MEKSSAGSKKKKVAVGIAFLLLLAAIGIGLMFKGPLRQRLNQVLYESPLAAVLPQGMLSENLDPNSSDENPMDSFDESDRGEGAGAASSGASKEIITEQMVFSSVIVQLASCLGLKKSLVPKSVEVRIQDLMELLRADLGEAQLVERWKEWKFKTSSGYDRQLRLETTEDDGGRLGSELHFFGIDKSGNAFPMELDPDEINNPNKQVVDRILQQGKVFYNEVASAALFVGGERLEFIEKNAKLREIEFLKADRVFRCKDVLAPKTCSCTD